MAKRSKHVKTASPISDSPAKTPKAEVGPNFYKLTPSWRIARLEMCLPFGWHEIEKDKLAEIHAKLKEFEALTWNELLIIRKHLHHSVEVYKLEKAARDRLAELGLDDYEEIVSLRLSGPERIWGIPQQLGAFTILWWDPHHKVYPYEKHNT